MPGFNRFFVLFAFLAFSLIYGQQAVVDKAAPGFALKDSNGKEHSLADYKGKYVVLEWVNYGCPFVKKHYDSNNMQTLQEKYTGKDVAWLAICSSAEGKQGYFDSDDVNDEIEDHNAKQTAYLVDEDGKVGMLYGAKTTPHMFVINPEGVLIYAGGIDDIRSTDVEDVKTAKNYVSLTLDAAMAGKAVPVKTSQPYGCSVKYK